MSSSIPTSVPAVPLGFNTSNPFPLVRVPDNLGLHVPQTTKDKIWGKQYIDLIKVVKSYIDSWDQQKIAIVQGQLVLQPKPIQNKSL